MGGGTGEGGDATVGSPFEVNRKPFNGVFGEGLSPEVRQEIEDLVSDEEKHNLLPEEEAYVTKQARIGRETAKVALPDSVREAIDQANRGAVVPRPASSRLSEAEISEKLDQMLDDPEVQDRLRNSIAEGEAAVARGDSLRSLDELMSERLAEKESESPEFKHIVPRMPGH